MVLVVHGLPDGRDQSTHAERHVFASLQLEELTNIKALAEYLGHSDAWFTLRTYTHLMPKAEDKARRAVDRVFDRLEAASNDPSCGPSVSQEGV